MAVTGFILVLVGTCLWGTLGPLERQLFSYGVSPVALSLVRAVMPTLVLLVYALATRRNLSRCLFATLPHKVANGFFGIVGLYVLGNIAFLRIPVAQAMIIFYTAPFWVLGLTHFTGKERFSFLKLAALACALAGIWIALGGNASSLKYDLIGVGAMLLAGFSYAIYLINGRYGIGNTDPFGNYLSTFFWGAALLLLAALPMGELSCLFQAPLRAWLLLAFISLIVSMGGYGLVLLALRIIPSGVVSILSTAEIFFAVLWSWLLIGESPNAAGWAGATLIVVAVTLAAWDGREHFGASTNIEGPQAVRENKESSEIWEDNQPMT